MQSLWVFLFLVFWEIILQSPRKIELGYGQHFDLSVFDYYSSSSLCHRQSDSQTTLHKPLCVAWLIKEQSVPDPLVVCSPSRF